MPLFSVLIAQTGQLEDCRCWRIGQRIGPTVGRINTRESGTLGLYTWAFLPSMILDCQDTLRRDCNAGHQPSSTAVDCEARDDANSSSPLLKLTIVCSNTMIGAMYMYVWSQLRASPT